MYGGYYGMPPGMMGGYNAGPMMSPQPQPPHVQARLRHAMGQHASANPGGAAMNGTMQQHPQPGLSVQPMLHNPGFMMMHNQDNFGAAMPPQGSLAQLGMMPRYSQGNPYPAPGGGSFSSSAGAGSLHRITSGVNFGYYGGSQMGMGSYGQMRRDSFAGSQRGSDASDGSPMSAGPDRRPSQQQQQQQQQELTSRPSSSLGNSYSYGSFQNASFTRGNGHTGASGVGPNASTISISAGGSRDSFARSTSSKEEKETTVAAPVSAAANGGGGVRMSPGPQTTTASLARQDSAASLQRHYSIAGQFYSFHSPNNNMANTGNSMMMPTQGGGGGGGWPGLPMGYMGGPPPGMTMTIGGLDGRVSQRMPGPGAMSTAQQQHMMMLHMQQQRRLSAQEAAGAASPSKGTSENAVVEEGQSMALGRNNSVSNLTRKSSEKRVGMYFKNKDASEGADGANYKKDGDTGTLGKNNTRMRDPSLSNAVKASLVLDMAHGANPAIEVVGRTIRAEKPGADEVQKYDLQDVLFANRATDVQLSSDSLDEMRDNFVFGCNVGMIMADAGVSAARPPEWFTWLALKSVVKGSFAKLGTSSFECTVSVCLLQDDQVLDLLSDEPQHFVPLTVAESPLFGNVANGMVFICVEDAGDFNDVLDASLEKAEQRQHHASSSSNGEGGAAVGEEYGIVLCTCVLKQIKTSPSSGKQDVVVSSIFASGVGDGVIHYNRILDKNPAEPRALFYSVLHRAVHSTAFFSCPVRDEEVFTYLATLQRFTKTETRRPKMGSTRAFVSYGTSTLPRIREDLEKAKEPRMRVMMQRQLEKLELMVADAEQMLENPTTSVPKTYI